VPNDNAIVGRVTGIEPTLEHRGAVVVLRENPAGVEISFEEATAVRLVPDEMAVGRLEILDQLRRMGQPAYVEIEPETRTIVQLLIPLVTRVSEVRDVDQGVRVILESSHGIHMLDRQAPDFDGLHSALEQAADSRATCVITETQDDHRIIDVRPWPHAPYPPESPATVEHPSSLFLRLWRWFRYWFCWYWCCVSRARAAGLFAQMSAATCSPPTVPAPCIPFLYPDDGCWARAHEMCRLMELQGARPRKIWIDGFLQTPTRNHPSCIVYWIWHVAPTLCVRRWWLFGRRQMVIDPSLFTAPVTLATWKSAQGDPNATLTPSAASLYWRVVMPSDPGYVDTNARLAYYRLQLQNRALQSGPPPYAFCP
jgi:Glutaminase